jgi:DNA-binding response OmpR family regulator
MTNILILEDDLCIALDIQGLLSEISFCNSFIASSLTDALKIANKYQIHILIADINIKGVQDGIDAASLLSSLYNCQIIFLTSFTDEITLQRVSKINFFTYIVKPFKEDNLIASIKLCIIKKPDDNSIISVGNGYIFDKKAQALFFNNEVVQLSAKEKLLFLVLFNSAGKIVPLSYIDEIVWQGEITTDTTRRQLLHRLKNKATKLSFKIIKSYGYIMESPAK